MNVLRIAACLLLAASGINLSGQDNMSASPQTVSLVFDKSVSAAERGTLALANAMPESRYSFAPTKGEFKGVRTFAQLARHIAVANYQMGAALPRKSADRTWPA